MTTTARGDGDPGPRWLLGRALDPLVRTVGRVPATVLAKLLVAFAGTVALLVVLGVLGLGVISDSNARVVTLGDLQQRATAYRQLQAGVAAIQQVVNLRAGKVPDGPFNPILFQSQFRADGRLVTDGLIGSLLGVQGTATDHPRLGFTPPAEDQGTLAQIAQDYLQLSDVMTRITDIDQAGGDANASLQLVQDDAAPLATDLKRLTDTLVLDAQAATNRLIALNGNSLAASQALFIAFALGSIALALFLPLQPVAQRHRRTSWSRPPCRGRLGAVGLGAT